MKKFFHTKFFTLALAGVLCMQAVPFSASAAKVSGDFNGDNVVSISDAVLLARYISQDSTLSAEIRANVGNMEVTSDMTLDARDLTCLSQYLSGIISYTEFTAGAAAVTPDETLQYLREQAAFMPAYPDTISEESFHSVPSQDIQPGLAQFSVNTIPTLLGGSQTENVVYSPLSYYMALSGLAEVVDGNGQSEILAALGVADTEELRTVNKDFFQNLFFQNTNGQKCVLANSIWLNDDYSYVEQTLQNLTDHYSFASYISDFSTPASSETATAWLQYYTGGKLPGAKVEFTPDTLARLINTIDFEDEWCDILGVSEAQTFTTADGSVVTADFVRYLNNSTYAIVDAAYTKASVPTKNGYQMCFVQPAADKSVSDLLADEALLGEILSEKVCAGENGVQCNLTLSAPMFSYGSKFKLNDLTGALGMQTVLEGGCFSPLTTDVDACVSSIIQEAHIAIDEKGCSAAAYTMISVDSTCMPEELPKVEMTLDRPFLYYLAGNDGTPLFVGVVNDPAAIS